MVTYSFLPGRFLSCSRVGQRASAKLKGSFWISAGYDMTPVKRTKAEFNSDLEK
jgi:hypothetical protein